MPINKIPQRAFSNDDMAVDVYTATAGQTAFTLSRAASVNALLVHVNDVIQQPTVDYTVAGTTLTMTSALSANDDVRIRIMTERPLGTQSGSSGATTLGALNDVSSAAPATGQVLKWSGTQWAPDTDATGGSGGGGGAFTSTTEGASLTSTTAGSSAGPEVELHRDITGADGNYIGQLKFTADNDADQKNVFAKITGKIGDASDGTEDGVMEFAVKKAGSNNINVRMTSTKFRLINGTELEVAGMTYPSTDGTSGQFLRTDGSGNLTFASIGSGGSGGIALTDLSVASEGTASGDGAIAYDNTNGQFTYTPPTLNGLTNAGDVDFGSNKILYSNHYAQLSDLPSASTYHGMFAHVHGTGKAYYAHAGNWVPLADESQLTLDGLTGVSTSGVTSGQVLKYNGTSWAPAADSAGSGGIALGDISVGAEGTPAGDGALAYNNSTGVFTYTPPIIPSVALPDDQEFGVTASGASAYTFTGAATGNNPTITLQRGKTYRFDVNASGHPFQIRVSNGGSNYTNGVVNAGTTSGAVYFTVPDDAPNSLVYQCTVHAAMVGTINIIDKIVPGHIIQTASQSFNPNTIQTASTSMVSTGISLGLTMASSSNNCLITVSGGHGYMASGYPDGLISTICRNGGTTTYSTSNDLTGGGSFGMEQIYNSTNLNTAGHSFAFLDTSVGTTTPVYRIFFRSRSGGTAVFHENNASFINMTVQEIAQ